MLARLKQNACIQLRQCTGETVVESNGEKMSKTSEWSDVLSEVQAKSKALNPEPLLLRTFVSLNQNKTIVKPNANGEGKSQPSLPSEDVADGVIRIMQWNLLAQGLCQTSDGFVLCPHDALDWKFRQHRLLEELLTYRPTIFCLQEVDQYTHILSCLAPLGFKGVFFPKPDSPCLYEANNYGPDGCAVLWDTSRLQLVDNDMFVLCKDCGRKTNQVAIVCRFRCVGVDEDPSGSAPAAQGKEFMVATTHLKAKKLHAELRAHQGRYLEEQLKKMVGDIPLVLCGDFNADPEEQAVKTMKSSSLNLLSAYTLLSPTQAEPAFTTWKVRGGKKPGSQQYEEVSSTIDYLFYSKDKIECLRLLEMPEPDSLKPNFLPSFAYPSDHLSLVADLRILGAV